MSGDYILYLDVGDRLATVKPIVLVMQEQLQKLYPEQDFTFKADEFVRDQPAAYELKITWYATDAFGPASFISYVLTRFELIWPEKIQRNILNYTVGLADCPTFREQLVKLLYQQRQLMNTGYFERLKSYDIRLTW